MKCNHNTLDNIRCKRQALSGRKRCWQHTIKKKMNQSGGKTPRQAGGADTYDLNIDKVKNGGTLVNSNGFYDFQGCVVNNNYKLNNHKVYKCNQDGNTDKLLKYKCNNEIINNTNPISYVCYKFDENEEIKFAKFKDINIVIKRGDITLEPANAIVNAANTESLPNGGGGLSGAIYKAAGQTEMTNARNNCNKNKGVLKEGEICMTDSFELNKNGINKVIHAAGPDLRSNPSILKPNELRSVYMNSLIEASNNGYERIAFPSISTGIFQYPVKEAARIAIKAILDFINNNPKTNLNTIIFVFFPGNVEKADIVYPEILDQMLLNPTATTSATPTSATPTSATTSTKSQLESKLDDIDRKIQDIVSQQTKIGNEGGRHWQQLDKERYALQIERKLTYKDYDNIIKQSATTSTAPTSIPSTVPTSIPSVSTPKISSKWTLTCPPNPKRNTRDAKCKHTICMNLQKNNCNFSGFTIVLNYYTDKANNTKYWRTLLGKERDGTYTDQFNLLGGKGDPSNVSDIGKSGIKTDDGCYIAAARRELAEEGKIILGNVNDRTDLKDYIKHCSSSTTGEMLVLNKSETPIFIGVFNEIDVDINKLNQQIKIDNKNLALDSSYREMSEVKWFKLTNKSPYVENQPSDKITGFAADALGILVQNLLNEK